MPKLIHIIHQEPPADVELVEDYGIFSAKRCIDDAVDSCRNSPTRLIRNLIRIFFSDILCESNACGKGKRQHKPLDQDIGHSQHFVIPFARTDSYLYSVLPSTINLWNSLPNSLIDLNDINHFKRDLSLHLLNTDWYLYTLCEFLHSN